MFSDWLRSLITGHWLYENIAYFESVLVVIECTYWVQIYEQVFSISNIGDCLLWVQTRAALLTTTERVTDVRLFAAGSSDAHLAAILSAFFSAN